MTQRLRIQLAKLYDEYQESKDSILFIKTYQKQMLEDQTEELGSSMNKLKLNLMQILKDVLLRWSSKLKAISLSAINNHDYSPAGKNHTDTPIKDLEGLENSPIQFDSARTNELYPLQAMKKGSNPGQAIAQESLQMSAAELEALVFSQRNEIKRLNAMLEEENNRSRSDLSVTSQDAENELKHPEKLREALNEIRREKDRIQHQVFGLEEDKAALEQDKENLADEIDKNQHMVNSLKEHIANLDAYRLQMESRLDTMTGATSPEQAFSLKYDYHKKLNDKLDEIQQIIITFCEINGITPPDEETEFEENFIIHSLTNFKPELPLSARENDIVIPENTDLISVIETINSFLKFIRTRAQTVIEEYDDYHQTLARLAERFKLQQNDPEYLKKYETVMEKVNELNIGECVDRSIYTALLNGRHFGRIFKSAVIKAMVELTNGINTNLLERREELIYQKKLIRTLLD